MAESAVSIDETNWMSKYFAKTFKSVVDKTTGISSQVEYRSCILPLSKNETCLCNTSYIFKPVYGTGNHIRHLLEKHGIVVKRKSIKDLNKSKVSKYLIICRCVMYLFI
jgi:hypothetical protein